MTCLQSPVWVCWQGEWHVFPPRESLCAAAQHPIKTLPLQPKNLLTYFTPGTKAGAYFPELHCCVQAWFWTGTVCSRDSAASETKSAALAHLEIPFRQYSTPLAPPIQATAWSYSQKHTSQLCFNPDNSDSACFGKWKEKNQQLLSVNQTAINETQSKSAGQKRFESFQLVRGSAGVGADVLNHTQSHWYDLIRALSGKRIKADTRARDAMSPARREYSHRRVEAAWHAASVDNRGVFFANNLYRFNQISRVWIMRDIDGDKTLFFKEERRMLTSRERSKPSLRSSAEWAAGRKWKLDSVSMFRLLVWLKLQQSIHENEFLSHNQSTSRAVPELRAYRSDSSSWFFSVTNQKLMQPRVSFANSNALHHKYFLSP